MERYDRYKDSGVEWIGEIPEGWGISKLALFARFHSGDALPADKLLPYGDYPVYGGGDIKGYLNEYNITSGSVIVSRQGATCGTCRYISTNAWATEHALVCFPITNIELRWLAYWLENMNLGQYSVSAAQPGISATLVESMSFPVFPREEQKAIADYLDKKTSQIDSLIDKNEKSIELLEEYRKSIISEAVTKGLDPNAPMKDSGVEWIGEIPEGWVTRRLKNFLDSVPHSIVDGPFGSDLKSDEYTDTGVPVTQLNNIKEGFHRVDSFKFVSESKAAQLSSHFVFPGDLLMAKMMPAGRTCIASSAYPKYLLSSDSIRIVIDSSVDRRFVCYAANCYCLAECELKSSGVTRIRINLSIVRNLSFVLPSLQEQKKIADYLDQKTAEIDSLIDKKKQLIEKLQEYRKSLISECATGKIKVPGVE